MSAPDESGEAELVDQLVATLDRGDGSTEGLLFGAVETIDQLVDAVNLLAAANAALDERVAALEDPEQATTIPLPEWVVWLRQSYGLGARIREDWDHHPGVTQELASLHAAWLAAFRRDGRPRTGAAATNWHDALARALARMQERWDKNDVATIPALPGRDIYPIGEPIPRAE